MGRISEESLERIRSGVAIAELIGDYVKLTRSGRSFKGLCPFHNERTPSFYVHPDRGFFHCFGCQMSGDIFRFVQEIEALDFVASVERLAERAGVELAEARGDESVAAARARSQKQRVLDALAAADRFFVAQLAKQPEAAVALLRERAMPPDTVAKFGLGFAPNSFDALPEALKRAGCALEDAELAGLVARNRQGKPYARFRGRLMCPVRDVSGRVLAFSGRRVDALFPPEKLNEAPKYYNSAESPVFIKGDQLFGLYEQRVALRKSASVLLCEGNFDVLQIASHPLLPAVAPLGTALTEAQVQLLRRFAERVVLAFDGDEAGRQAALKSLQLLLPSGLRTQVLWLPGGDPDSVLREEGAEAFSAQLSQALEGDRFVLSRIFEGLDAEDVNAYGRAAKEVRRWADLLDGFAREAFVANALKYFPAAVRRRAQHFLASSGASARTRPSIGAPPAELPEATEDRSMLSGTRASLVGLALDAREALEAPQTIALEEALAGSPWAVLVPWLQARAQLEDASSLPESLGEAPRHWVLARLACPQFSAEDAALGLASSLGHLHLRRLRESLARCNRALSEALRAGDAAQVASLKQESVNLQKSLREMQATKSTRARSA